MVSILAFIDSDSDEVVIIGSEGLDDTNDGDVIFVSQYKSSSEPITIDCTTSKEAENDSAKVVHLNEEQHCEMDEDDVQDISTISSIKLADFCQRSSQIYNDDNDPTDQLVIKPRDSLGSLSIGNNFGLSLSVEEHNKTQSKPVMVVDVSPRIETPMENDGEPCTHELSVCDKCLPDKEENSESRMDFRTNFDSTENKVIMKKEENVLPQNSGICKWNVDEPVTDNCSGQKASGLQLQEEEDNDTSVTIAPCSQTAILSSKYDPCCSDSSSNTNLIYHCIKEKNGISEHPVAMCQKLKTKFCHSSDPSPPNNSPDVTSVIDHGSPRKKHMLTSRTWIPASVMAEEDNQRAVKKGACVACKALVKEDEGSSCVDHHLTCRGCLEDKVKAVLSRRCLETSVKCLEAGCNNFYSKHELRRCLPAMIVDILEEVLEQYYVDFITNMLMKSYSPSDASVGPDNEMTVGELERPRKRLAISYDSLPENWVEMESKFSNQLFVLDTDSPEYVNVSRMFLSSMHYPATEIVRISRIQNPILWKYYCLKKREMVQENDGLNVEERQLFHGTKSKVVEPICRKGFDWRLCGKHGTVYGHGSYFAGEASYSHQFTDDIRIKRQRPIPAGRVSSNNIAMTTKVFCNPYNKNAFLKLSPSINIPSMNPAAPLQLTGYTSSVTTYTAQGSIMASSSNNPFVSQALLGAPPPGAGSNICCPTIKATNNPNTAVNRVPSNRINIVMMPMTDADKNQTVQNMPNMQDTSSVGIASNVPSSSSSSTPSPSSSYSLQNLTVSFPSSGNVGPTVTANNTVMQSPLVLSTAPKQLVHQQLQTVPVTSTPQHIPLVVPFQAGTAVNPKSHLASHSHSKLIFGGLSQPQQQMQQQQQQQQQQKYLLQRITQRLQTQPTQRLQAQATQRLQQPAIPSQALQSQQLSQQLSQAQQPLLQLQAVQQLQPSPQLQTAAQVPQLAQPQHHQQPQQVGPTLQQVTSTSAPQLITLGEFLSPFQTGASAAKVNMVSHAQPKLVFGRVPSQQQSQQQQPQQQVMAQQAGVPPQNQPQAPPQHIQAAQQTPHHLHHYHHHHHHHHHHQAPVQPQQQPQQIFLRKGFVVPIPPGTSGPKVSTVGHSQTKLIVKVPPAPPAPSQQQQLVPQTQPQPPIPQAIQAQQTANTLQLYCQNGEPHTTRTSIPTNCTRKMFIAKVLVGKYTGGNSSLKKAPPLYPCAEPFGKCYDSCVDNIWDPKIFVIFDSAQAYPDYLIEYVV